MDDRRSADPVASPTRWPMVDARIYSIDLEFLLPYLEPFGHFVDQPETADWLLAMNSTAPDAIERLAASRKWNKPLAWWTIEDPNAFEIFLPHARQADVVFTTDEACIPRYIEHLGHQRVFWLPLACAPHMHYPLANNADARDFVISANWYANEARRWGVDTVVEPIVRAGYSLALFCYSTFMWPSPYQQFWHGETNCRTVADQYRCGRVVLGLNNQRSGLDGRGRTVMTSMRTFEALACGKAFLSAHSDAYERLGLIHGEHMVWVSHPAETLHWAQRLLGPEGEAIAGAGRAFVLERHTYGHRLASIAQMMMS
jgi:spore maturation protein CgeB